MNEAMYVTNEKFDIAMARLFSILERFEQRLTNIEQRLTNFELRLTHIEFRVGQIEVSLEEIKENLFILSDAEAKDAMASINHERRIAVLERRGGIQSRPPQHLLELE